MEGKNGAISSCSKIILPFGKKYPYLFLSLEGKEKENLRKIVKEEEL